MAKRFFINFYADHDNRYLFARIAMIVDLLPVKRNSNPLHAWKAWPKEMNERTKGLPIVFSNSINVHPSIGFIPGK